MGGLGTSKVTTKRAGISFDVTDGTYRFETTDAEMHPLGEYLIELIGSDEYMSKSTLILIRLKHHRTKIDNK